MPLNQTIVTDQPLPAGAAVPQSETPGSKEKGKGSKSKGKSGKKGPDETSNKKTPQSNKTPTEKHCARHGDKADSRGNSQ